VTSLRIFAIGGLMSFRALFGFMSPWIFVPALVVTPLFQILLFVYIGRSAGLESDAFYVVGNAIQYASVPCLFAMTNTIAGERYNGTLGPVLVSPAGRLPLFLGRSVPVVVNGAFVAALSFTLGSLLVGVAVPGSSIAPLALVALVAAASCTGLGLVMAGIGLRVRETAVMLNIVFGFLLILTGANVPVDELPDWMAAISNVLPFTHAIEAGRELVSGGALDEVSGLLAREVAIGAAYAAVGYGFLRFMERQGRVHATLEKV
jgi:ABC-2 type transport system permease protein